jgi:CRISPR system Cascade subunit CasD
MLDYLILRLQGAMQAWGGHTYEDYRPSLVFPTRSGVVGLLAACLGIDRKDLSHQKELSNSFTYAVRVDDRSYQVHKIKDFHIVQNVPKVDGTIRNSVVSIREYLCDAHFTLAMKFTKDSGYDLEIIKQAVDNPVFTPVLGRRCCPISRPLFDSVVQAKGFLGALAQITPGCGTVYSEVDESSTNTLSVRDVPRFNGLNQFDTRSVYIHAQEVY